tara:strand:+ start:463 stop:1035 length:573 start_codon:yes stop_codon:yes gene_type:complete
LGKQDYYIKKLKGIYRIAHKVSGMCYVGQSVDISSRWRQHLTPNKSCIGQAIAAEPDQFTFEILEECSKEMMNEREKHWIEFYNCVHPSGYNKTSGGSSSTEVSEDTKKKISEMMKGKTKSDEHKKKLSAVVRGPVSDETLKRMSAASKNRIQSEESRQKKSEALKGRTPSDETKQKMSDAAKKRWQRTD